MKSVLDDNSKTSSGKQERNKRQAEKNRNKKRKIAMTTENGTETNKSLGRS